MLIDVSYFTKGSRRILNAMMGKAGMIPRPDSQMAPGVVEGYIAECQEPFLCEVLGHALGNKVHAYLVCIDEDETQTRIESFDAVCDRLRESFADYVYYHFLQGTASEATIIGLIKIKNANTPVAPNSRQVMAWNSMVDRNRSFARWCGSAECTLSGIDIAESMLTKINVFNI